MSGDPKIAELWSVKIKDLYNRCDLNKRTKLLEEVKSFITTQDLVSLSVSIDTVLRAINQLKPGKSDGKSLMSDHVLYAPPILVSKLAELFTSLLQHGHAAVCLRDTIIQPIPKGAKILPSRVITMVLHSHHVPASCLNCASYSYSPNPSIPRDYNWVSRKDAKQTCALDS